MRSWCRPFCLLKSFPVQPFSPSHALQLKTLQSTHLFLHDVGWSAPSQADDSGQTLPSVTYLTEAVHAAAAARPSHPHGLRASHTMPGVLGQVAAGSTGRLEMVVVRSPSWDAVTHPAGGREEEAVDDWRLTRRATSPLQIPEALPSGSSLTPPLHRRPQRSRSSGSLRESAAASVAGSALNESWPSRGTSESSGWAWVPPLALLVPEVGRARPAGDPMMERLAKGLWQPDQWSFQVGSG